RRRDEGLGDERHPSKESPVRDHDVHQEVLVGGHGRILDFLMDPVPESAAGLPTKVVRRYLPARLLPPEIAIEDPREGEWPERRDRPEPGGTVFLPAPRLPAVSRGFSHRLCRAARSATDRNA